MAKFIGKWKKHDTLMLSIRKFNLLDRPLLLGKIYPVIS